MKAGPTTLKRLIEGEKQYRVPIFQRPYTWADVELKQLWTDILAQYEVLREVEQGATRPSRSAHFLGSFVLAPVPAQPHGIAPYLVVDGQQRLLTLFLALAALRDLESEVNDGARAKYDRLYLKNEYAEALEVYKVLPSLGDRDQFFACMDRRPIEGDQSKISFAFQFFQRRFRTGISPVEGEAPVAFDLELIKEVIVNRLAVIDITTEADDNPFRIFASLNGTGVGLTQADLLRNYVFMMLPNQGEQVYKQVWYPMEASLGNEEHLEGLARVDLLRRGIDVTRDEVYRRHQERLEVFAGQEGEIVREVKDLARQAQFYRKLIDPGSEPDQGVRDTLLRLNRWGAQTTYPLLMHLYGLLADGRTTISDIRDALGYLESFIVRRFLCQVPTNQLNRLFVELIKNVNGQGAVSDAIREELSGPRRYWPTDEQVRSAIRSRPFYLMGRADQRKMILERLEESYEHKEAVTLSGLKLSIEHILPQTLSPEWQAELHKRGEDPEELFSELGHTLGNLTLTAYNGELGNSLFRRKKQIFESSNLQLNHALAKSDHWGREEILTRAAQLAELTVGVWPAPLPGSKGVVIGFDWNRIDNAVRALPSGRWTSYGDLAALGQTHAHPVGVHMACAGIGNTHRVLDAHGYISADFHWLDPTDSRSIREVLESEGLMFGPDGTADGAQRLDGYELAQLIPYELDAEEMDDLRRRFKEGGHKVTEGRGSWLEDGKAWHLGKLQTQAARDLLLGLVTLVEDSADGIGKADWAQKYYIVWRNHQGRSWAAIHPRQKWMWFDLWGAPVPAPDVAQQLGYVFVPPGSPINSSYDGPSQVCSVGSNDGVSVQLRHLGDLTGARADVLRSLVGATWTANQQENAHEDAGSWLEDGKTWHLAKLQSPSARELLLGLVSLVESSAEGIGQPDWGQKRYIAWRKHGGYRWAVIGPHQQWMRLNLRGAQLDAADVAKRLGYEFVSPGASIDTSHNGASQVSTLSNNVGISIQFRQLTDLSGSQGDVLRSLVRDTWTASHNPGAKA